MTAVGPLTFAGCMVGEVSLPGTITSIGEAAFENSALTSIDIPAAVTSIGRWAFTGTPYLERIHVDEGKHRCRDGYGSPNGKLLRLQQLLQNGATHHDFLAQRG